MMSASRPLAMNSSPMAQPAYGARYCNGAGSDALAATMTVCSMAPYSSSVAWIEATLLCFWPTAT